MNVFGVTARPDEARAELPGDALVAGPDVVMDRAFSLAAPPAEAWPWFAQLGKGRSGWYLPRWAERFVPSGRRALRHIDVSLQGLKPGDVIDDWGGAGASFEIVRHDPPTALVHRSTRGAVQLSWAIALRPEGVGGTRVHLRLRLAGLRHRRLVELGGGLFDLLTIAGLAAGLRERIRATHVTQ